MSCVTAVEGEWLPKIGPMFFSIKESIETMLVTAMDIMIVVYAVYLFCSCDRDEAGNGNGNNDSGSGAGDGGAGGGGVCCILYFALVIETMPVTTIKITTVAVAWWCQYNCFAPICDENSDGSSGGDGDQSDSGGDGDGGGDILLRICCGDS